MSEQCEHVYVCGAHILKCEQPAGHDTREIPHGQGSFVYALCEHQHECGWTFDFQARRVYCRQCEGER